MSYSNARIGMLLVVPLLAWLPALRADCPAIDFEDLAVGTAVTTQYSGVTISVQPQSCNNSPRLYMKVVTATGGTSSGTKAIRIDTGCPDFSPDYLRIVFTDLHREVRFTVGEGTGTAGYDFDVRYYSDVSLLGTLHVESGSGCNRVVHVGSSTGPQVIRRIEVDSPIDAFEEIDDLAFGMDTTPPIAQIDSPTYEACVYSSVQVRGIACDPDGAYDHDTLEYRSVNAASGTPWTLVGSATLPVCESDPLYNWNTASIPHGKYYLRLTVTNACGLTSSAVAVVYVDRQFDTLAMRHPAEGAVIGGAVCIDGTVWDHLCFDHYTVDYQPSAGGAWTPVNPASPTYATAVTDDPFASWDTKSTLSDGNYRLRVVGYDGGNSATLMHAVTVDNTLPVALITSPRACDYLNGVVTVRGTANDAHLAGWRLYYSGGDAHGWIPIGSGNTAVINNELANWDTTGLRWCAYTLRLVVTDEALLDCNMTLHNEREYTLSVNVGANCDIDGDGSVTNFDIDPFVECLIHGGNPAP